MHFKLNNIETLMESNRIASVEKMQRQKNAKHLKSQASKKIVCMFDANPLV